MNKHSEKYLFDQKQKYGLRKTIEDLRISNEALLQQTNKSVKINSQLLYAMKQVA